MEHRAALLLGRLCLYKPHVDMAEFGTVAPVGRKGEANQIDYQRPNGRFLKLSPAPQRGFFLF